MYEFSGINRFGSLTTQNGVKLDYKTLVEKYDDGDGKISLAEFRNAVYEEKLDHVDLSTVNSGQDNEITEDEMAVYEQKYQMQEAVNAMKAQITKDFSGGSRPQYFSSLTRELTNYITEFADNYSKENADVSGMAEAFKAALPAKYAEIKRNILKDDPSLFRSEVLDNMVERFIQDYGRYRYNSTESDEIRNRIKEKYAITIEAEADKYIKANPNCMENELWAHLRDFADQIDADKMKEAANTFKSSADSLGVYIDSQEINKLKEYAKEFLTEALDNSVTINLGGKNITKSASGKDNIDSVLKTYTNGDKLKADMEAAIANLSKVSKTESIISQARAEQYETDKKEAEAEDKRFRQIDGSAYQINTGLIDYSQIDKRYLYGGNISSDSIQGAYNSGHELFCANWSNGGLKAQYKAQIEAMLNNKGVSFDKVASIFENVYTQTVAQVLNSEGMITRSENRYSGVSYNINVQKLFDTFAITFNTNIENTINQLNGNDKDAVVDDFNVDDLDYSLIGKDENGESIIDEATGKDLSTLYESGETITANKAGAYYYNLTADRLIEQMKSQMVKKAYNMCKSVGIEFDAKSFKTLFNSAKSTAIQAGVESSNSLLSVKETIDGILNGTDYKNCSLNVKTLIDTFTDAFTTDYSAWVETEVDKNKDEK